jgi:aldehyde dehydrogenase (NAD+)
MTTGMRSFDGSLLIGGQSREASDRGSFESRDPSSGEVIAAVSAATPLDVDHAVEAARDAARVWRDAKPVERGRILHAVGRVLHEHRDELAMLETLDTGKPLRQGFAAIDTAIRYFEFYGGLADKILGTTIPLGGDVLDYTVREPFGVSAQIVPWNYPLQIGARGAAPALATGNTVVMKPASEASLSLLLVARLALEAGLPPGTLNVVPGSGSVTGNALAAHPGVDQMTFTGSVEVGTRVMVAAAQNVVPVLLELGGKSPNIVFEDADLDVALPIVVRSILNNAGQTCSAGSRVLVQRSIADQVLGGLAELMSASRIGPGVDDLDLGPLISARQATFVHEMVTEGVRSGVEVLTGGDHAPESEAHGGAFYSPTLIMSRPGLAVAREEIFGPVLVALVFDDEDEAVSIANETEFGLVAGVWTRDVGRAHRVAHRVQAGHISINDFGGGGVETPFGGYRKSGFGREKGVEGLNPYLQTKNIALRLTQ